MSIGYACLALGVPGTDLKGCVMRNADGPRLRALTSHNLDALERMIDYNIRNGIRLFRISSDIVPFASSPVNAVPWAEEFGERFRAIGEKIRSGGLRVSMHPGQYTVLNSPNEETVRNAVRELEVHALFLDSLGVDDDCKIILHVGGVYGDKREAVKRFSERYRALDWRVKARLVIENDDRIYNAQDVLDIGLKEGIPAVYDNLHHLANPAPGGGEDREWIRAFARTWGPLDGPQKIHYSQGNREKKTGAHSLSIAAEEFLAFHEGLDDPKPDIMLEVKDKNVSALKCILLTEPFRGIGALEREWGRYKYLVLERSQALYREIRELLKDKRAFPAREFFRLIEAALALPADPGSAVNAASHVWGYFKDLATERQKKDFGKSLDGYRAGTASLGQVKRKLYAMAEEYWQDYLLESYYFVPQYGVEGGGVGDE